MVGGARAGVSKSGIRVSVRAINQRLNIKFRATSQRSDGGDGLSADSDIASC